MSDSNLNEVREYLLGRLSHDAAENFEERFFASDELLRALEEEREALIDDYLAGALSDEDEETFRKQMRQSTSLKDRVDQHRRLLLALERRSGTTSEKRRLEKLRWVWMGVACTVLAVAGNSLLMLSLKRAEVKVATVDGTLPAPAQKAEVDVPDAVFFLSARVTRGTDSLPVLKMPRGAKLVELQVELPADAEAVGEWQLADIDGKTPSPQTGAEQTHRVEAGQYVAVKLSADALPTGVHTIRLTGTSAREQFKSAAIVREFRVIRSGGVPVLKSP